MKKIIVLALVLSMLALMIVPSFADSTEEEKIIEAAQKGTVLYELLDYHYPAVLSVIQNVNHHKDENYDFIYEMVPDINDETGYIGDFAAFMGQGTKEEQLMANKKIIVNATVNQAITSDPLGSTSLLG